MNGKSDVGSNSITLEEILRLELDGGGHLEINFGIAYSGVSIGPPRPPLGTARLINWSVHPVGINQVGVLQITEHGP